MFRLMLVGCVVALFTPAPHVAAQSVARTIDLSSLGWGIIEAYPIEADGALSTEEWVVRQVDTWPDPNRWRVVAIESDGICAGDWFTPAETAWVPITLVILKGRSHLQIGTFPRIAIVSLDRPAC